MIEFIKQYGSKIGWIIWLLNFLAAAGSSWLFLKKAKLPFAAWICFNPCALSAMIFLIGYLLRKNEIMAASVPFLLFYSIAGLIIFGWNKVFIPAQISHIFMICAMLYTGAMLYSETTLLKPAIGFFTGLLLFALFLPVQQKYVKEHQRFAKNMGHGEEELITKQRGLFYGYSGYSENE